ncbi:uncharacterized protein LOC114260305 isoform X3 [Camellia sinensis]|uniref:uncharacterized protein LOC114260305 isoform X3 n=2 Tax=Camellia sinensis TaxID=4442 RepID=UPI001035FB3D|nr:uncharacterized protein LOC114260305 isoform X3 [Camellia sinensis]
MKGFMFWVLFLLTGTALMFLCLSKERSTSSVPAMALNRHGDNMTVKTRGRKLKENCHASITDKSNSGSIKLEDYNPIDLGPSSKASVRPGPIQYGTPLMPYIPKPSPPDHPKQEGFPYLKCEKCNNLLV